LVNGVLRHLEGGNEALEKLLQGRSQAEQLALQFSHPAWLIERWLATYGELKTRQLLHYNNQAPLMGFRINRLKADAKDFFDNPTFAAAMEPCELPYFFLSREFSLFETALQEGILSVQNPTQALAPLLLNPAPQSVVIDLCAAPGGKAMFMAELMHNQGEVIAVDRYEQKLRKLENHAQALGLTIIRTVAGDARSFAPNLQADAVLLDAPCSGTGVIGRRAELRWKVTPAMVAELQGLQAELLDHAATLLKPQGRLVYATCSIEPEENGEQVAAFLQRHPNFVAEPHAQHLTLPGDRYGYDGGFCQLMYKMCE
jgi:16S rRNA (cytosine967-C5)-methyltransferase